MSGQINDHDLQNSSPVKNLQIKCVIKDNRVFVLFNQPVSNFGLDRANAEGLAAEILRKAQQCSSLVLPGQPGFQE